MPPPVRPPEEGGLRQDLGRGRLHWVGGRGTTHFPQKVDKSDIIFFEIENEKKSGVGYHEFGSFSGKSDDAEAVAVAPGCVLTVYDEDDEDVEKRGDSRCVIKTKVKQSKKHVCHLFCQKNIAGFSTTARAGTSSWRRSPGVWCVPIQTHPIEGHE